MSFNDSAAKLEGVFRLKKYFCAQKFTFRKEFYTFAKKNDTMEEEKVKTAKVVQKIAALRSKKGYTCENMADGLDITPAAYHKIETGKTKLTVERMFKIAEILDERVSALFEADATVFNQTNLDNATGYQYQQTIENLFQENKDVYERLIASKDEQINLLRTFMQKNT